MTKDIFVKIEKIIPGGIGLAKDNSGKVLMVPGVLPDEVVKVGISKRKKSYIEAELLEVLEHAPVRTDPPCHYYGTCGGCDFQHMTYSAQCQIKQSMLQEQLSRVVSIGKNSECALRPFLAADSPLHYRQRIRLQVDKGRLGFFQPGSHQIVPVSSCLLSEPAIDEVLQEMQNDNDMLSLLRHAEAVEMKLSPVDKSVVVFVHFTRKPRPKDKIQAQKVVDNIALVKFIVFQTKQWGNTGPFYQSDHTAGQHKDMLEFIHTIKGNSIPMVLEANGFCQVNSTQNLRLIETMLEWASLSKEDTVLDLYCGMGNFSIPAAKYAARVHGMDLQRSAIRSAKRNADLNDLTNCFFEQKSAVDGASQLAESGETYSVVLLDPPRSGCREILPFINRFANETIIYISCDPATLSRDLMGLSEIGYKVDRVQGVDMFPNTHHIETIVLLKAVSE